MTALAHFVIEEVAANVFRLGTWYVGFYVLADGGRYTLVDSALPGYWGQLVRFLADRGSTIDDIEAQVLTHHHVDHRGLTERLRKEVGAKVHIHATDAPYIEKTSPPPKAPLWKASVLRYFAHLIRHGVIRTRPVVDAATFEDGDTLDLPGRPRVVHVPGHTLGHCCLFLENKRVLFAGDALAGVNLITGEIGPVIAPSFVNDDSALALESLSNIENLDADLVLTVHGPHWKGPVSEAVRAARLAGVY